VPKYILFLNIYIKYKLQNLFYCVPFRRSMEASCWSEGRSNSSGHASNRGHGILEPSHWFALHY